MRHMGNYRGISERITFEPLYLKNLDLLSKQVYDNPAQLANTLGYTEDFLLDIISGKRKPSNTFKKKLDILEYDAGRHNVKFDVFYLDRFEKLFKNKILFIIFTQYESYQEFADEIGMHPDTLGHVLIGNHRISKQFLDNIRKSKKILEAYKNGTLIRQ